MRPRRSCPRISAGTSTRQPVVAREPSFRYIFAKAAQRHRAGFAAAAISIVALLAALGVSLWERHLAVIERNRATARFNDVRQIANAMIFKIDNAVQPLPGSTPLRRQIVAEALVYLERLNSDPNRDDALSLEMARAYHRVGDVQGNPTVANLGDRVAALASYRKAIDLLRPMTSATEIGHDAAIELGRVEISFASVSLATGDRDGALKALEDARQVADAVLRQDPKDDGARRLAGSVAFQAGINVPKSESLPYWQRARDIFGTLLAEKPDDTDRQRNVALSEKYIGAYYENQEDFASALTHHVQAQDLDERRLRAKPSDRVAQFDVAIDLSNIAFAEWQTKHLAAAATHYEQSLEMRKRLAESDPSDVLARSRVAYAHSRLALLYDEMNELSKTLDHAREAARLGESMARIDPEHAELYADDLHVLGRAEERAGHAAAACAAFRQAFDLTTVLVANTSVDPNLTSRVKEIRGRVQGKLASCGPEKSRR